MWNAYWLPSIPVPELTSERFEQFILLVLVCLAVAAFGSAYDEALAWIFWLPCVVSLFWRIQRVPAWLANGARYSAHLFEALALLLGLIFMAYPVLSAETATRLTLLAGFGLTVFAGLFLLGTPVWPRASTLFPAMLGLLVVACFNPLAKHRALLVGAGVAVFAYLSLSVIERGVRRVAIAQWIRLASFAFLAALVAGAIIVVVPRLQSKTEDLAFQFFQTQVPAYSGLSDTTRLGDLEELKLSSLVVMRVWTDRPQDLRARAYSHFDGRGWTVSPDTYRRLPTIALDTVSDARVRDWLANVPGSIYAISGSEACSISDSCVRTRIIQNVFSGGMMVSPGNKVLARAALPSLRTDSQENLRPLLADGVEVYGILNRHAGDIVQPAPASSRELREALELPENTDPRIREISARLAEGATTPEEKVRRTVDYLQHQYHYTLKIGNFRTSQPVAEFLFEKKKGYCQYFASAAAVLLRQEGVATRYVSGFHVTENNRSGDHYVIREMDAHAWIEAYIPGQGWVQTDPTPAAEYESLHANLGGGFLNNALEWVRAERAEIHVYFREQDWRTWLRRLWERTSRPLRGVSSAWGGMTMVAILLLAWLGRHARRKKFVRENRSAANAQIESIESAPALAQLLRRLDLYWTKCGIPRPPHRAPLEHLECIPAGKFSPDIRRAFRHLIETYYLASFGGKTLRMEELHTLQREFNCVTSSCDNNVHD
jgi:transglutaminase-like putative cysteine protease